MKRYFLPFVIACALFACEKEEQPQNTSKIEDQSDYVWSVSSYWLVRSLQPNLDPSCYLGYGFNVLKHAPTDVRGISQKPLLAIDKPAWTPWGGETGVLPTKLIVQNNESPKTQNYYHLNVTEGFQPRSIDFQGVKGLSFAPWAYYPQDLVRSSTQSHTYQSLVYQARATVAYDVEDYRGLASYLTRDFVRDLGKMSATELVEKYGTHLVMRYVLGPYMKLSVSAKASVFSPNEVKKIEMKAWEGSSPLSPELQQKVRENKRSLSMRYEQAGSDYNPQDLAQNLTDLGRTHQLDDKAWERGLRSDDAPFLMLSEGEAIPIPDLIADVPLKMKYISGILYQSLPKGVSAINYVLYNPKDYQRVVYNGHPIRLVLPNYRDAQVVLHIGLDTGKILTEGALLAIQEQRHKWDIELSETGLWTIKSRLSGKYLCTDTKLRTLAEDSEGLRYWLLNPILPPPEGHGRNLSRLLLRSNH